MWVAIVSDSHDNLWKVEAAREPLTQADALLHCGDWVAPFTLKRFIDIMGGKPIHGIFGNNDGERRLLARMAAAHPNVHLYGDFAEITLGGLRFALTHYPEIARPLAACGHYDVVCYGHNHQAHQETVGPTLLLNPGELFGGLTGRSSLILLNTQTRQIRWVDLS